MRVSQSTPNEISCLFSLDVIPLSRVGRSFFSNGLPLSRPTASAASHIGYGTLRRRPVVNYATAMKVQRACALRLGVLPAPQTPFYLSRARDSERRKPRDGAILRLVRNNIAHAPETEPVRVEDRRGDADRARIDFAARHETARLSPLDHLRPKRFERTAFSLRCSPGHLVVGPSEAFTAEEMMKVFDTNLFRAQRVNRAVLPYMRRQESGQSSAVPAQALEPLSDSRPFW
jgi:hypothetical protein